MDYKIKNIAGITTIIAPMQESNSTTIEILVKAGSNYETRDTNGISHFLEHMFFKWWKKYKTPKQVAETVDSFGWEFNAFTSWIYAGYYVKSAPNFIDKSIDILWDMLVNAQFPVKELEKEKNVVIQEIMMKQDNPSSLVYDKRKNFFFWDNSYGRSTLGPIENIKNFNQDLLCNHKNSLYTKDNLVITISWKFTNVDEIENMVSDAFWKLPDKKTNFWEGFLEKLPNQKLEFFDKKTEQNHLIVSAKWFTWTDPQRYSASILATILWWNMSSRLFQSIREKEWLCYYIGGSHYSSPHTGTFVFRSGLEKWRFEFALNRIQEEISEISKWNIKEEELENALWYKTWQIQMWIESSDEMASFLWEQYLLYGKIETLEEILENYKAQGIKEIKDVAKKLEKQNLFSYRIQ